MITFGNIDSAQWHTMTTTHRKFSLFLAALAAGFLAVAASAMGIGQASGTNQGNGGALYSDLGPATMRPAEFLARFVELTQADLAANAALLTSLGLGDDAGRTVSQRAGFTPETTPSNIEATVGAAAAAQELVLTKLASRPVLTPENQAMFADGALALVRSAKGFRALTVDFVAVKKAMVDAGAKGRLALYAAKTVPSTATRLRQELQAMVQFAKANNISLAAEVYDAAGAM
jgi:hypothetical protein